MMKHWLKKQIARLNLIQRIVPNSRSQNLLGMIHPVFGVDTEGDHRVHFECIHCRVPLYWRAKVGWECELCGIELKIDEARTLCEESKALLTETINKIDKTESRLIRKASST